MTGQPHPLFVAFLFCLIVVLYGPVLALLVAG